MLHTKFQASKPNGPGPPGAGPSWTQGPSFKQNIFFNVAVGLEPRTPGAGPSWTLGPSFEQTW